MEVGSFRLQEVRAVVRRLVDPNQVDTSNEFGSILSPVALRRLHESWQHLFRRVILEMMLVDTLATYIHEVMGRPTKRSQVGEVGARHLLDWDRPFVTFRQKELCYASFATC